MQKLFPLHAPLIIGSGVLQASNKLYTKHSVKGYSPPAADASTTLAVWVFGVDGTLTRNFSAVGKASVYVADGETAIVAVADAGEQSASLKADDMQGGIAGPTRTLPRLNDRDWHQAGPPWVTTPAGALTPCDAVAEDGNLLVYTAEAFRSFELSFTFTNQHYMDSWSGGGVAFRADNSTSYDFWSFDSIAMQERAEAAWAVVGSVRGDGWRRAHPGLIGVPGVGSAPGLVHHARVQLTPDGTLRSWVDEYPLPPQQLPPRTRPGRVGLYAYNMIGGGPRMIFSNVTITGTNATDAPAFGVTADPATTRPWSIVAGPINRSDVPASPIDDSGQVGNAVVAPNVSVQYCL